MKTLSVILTVLAVCCFFSGNWITAVSLSLLSSQCWDDEDDEDDEDEE